MLEVIFLLVACLCFGLAAFGVGALGRIGLVPAGLFFFALSFLWPHLLVDLH
jgi:hypothetical protein